MIIIAIVILPMTLIAASLTQEALGVYGKVQSGEMDPVRFFKQVHDASPAWASTLLDGFGLESLGAVQEKLSAGLMAGTRLTEPTVTIILKNPNVPRREHFGRA
jgi:hypothetical protein